MMVHFSERIWYFSSLIQEEKIAVIDQKWDLAVVIYKFFVLIFLVTWKAVMSMPIIYYR